MEYETYRTRREREHYWHPSIRAIRRVFSMWASMLAGFGLAYFFGSERLHPIAMVGIGIYGWLGIGLALQAIALVFIQARKGQEIIRPTGEIVMAAICLGIAGSGLLGLLLR